MTDSAGIYFEEHKESADLGRRALRGGFISVAVQYGNGVLQIIAAIFLARLLVPEDFGLVAIVTVLTSFAPALIDCGLADVTSLRNKITQSQISSLFWFSSGLGSSIAAVVATCSPLIAWIYRDVRLETIALCAATTFVLCGLTNLHMALLRRTMQFGAIAKIQVLGTLVGVVVALAMAYFGYGYWALVFRPIAAALCIVIGAWFACRWRPGRPVFDDEVKSMIRFGLYVVGFSVASTVAKSVDRMGLGLFYPPEEVGYYQNAIALYEYSIFFALTQLHIVGSSTLAKLQSNPAALRQKYEAALSSLAFFAMPAAAILSVTGQDVTVILLGEKWRATGLLLSITALRGIFQAIDLSKGWLHLAIGRPDRWQKWGIITLGVQIIGVLSGLPFGPAGVAVATVVTGMLVAIPAISYAGRPIGIGAGLVIQATGRQLIGAICIVAAGWWLQVSALAGYSHLVRIILSASFCACLYLIIVAGLFRLIQPIKVAVEVIKDQLLRNR
jgi:PST family polysaccharide transporter